MKKKTILPKIGDMIQFDEGPAVMITAAAQSTKHIWPEDALWERALQARAVFDDRAEMVAELVNDISSCYLSRRDAGEIYYRIVREAVKNGDADKMKANMQKNG